MSLVKELIEAGIHFGQRRSNWNPKMAPYIHGVRGGIHIIDIKETVKGLLLAKKFISRVAADGKDVVFVGTKRQARGTIEEQCTEAKLPYVTERWLGGTLTNFRTIRERLKRLEELDQLIESGEIKSYSKKMESQLMREQRKIHRNLNGIRNMANLPGAMVVIDVNREKYRPVAFRGTILYFNVVNLGIVDPMYQFSLQWFTNLFIQSIRQTEAAETLEEAFRDALLTNVLNPKVVLLFLALMPQFLRENGWPVPMQLAFLGILLILVNTIWQTMLALLAGGIRQWLGRPTVQRLVSWATGAVLVGFAVLMLRDFVLPA